MISAIRNLTLAELCHRFREEEADMQKLRKLHGAEFAPLLVESGEKIPRVYSLQKMAGRPDVVQMRVDDMDEEKQLRLPFKQRREKAIGPVIKRSFSKQKGPGPTRVTQNITMNYFTELAEGNDPWSSYFMELVSILTCPTLHWEGSDYSVGDDSAYSSILAAAIDLIPEKKDTVFLTVIDKEGRWPGERPEYHEYLTNMLAEMKYTTKNAQCHQDGICPLCGIRQIPLYPNALRGAGINLGNMDRAGAFPGIDASQAWKGYALCLDCADMLYIFKNHISQNFIGIVAGSKALLLPSLLGNPEGRIRFMKDFRAYVRGLEGDRLRSLEKNLMEFFAGQDDAHVVLHILWAKFGQAIDEVSGAITDVLPSRLRKLADLNREANKWAHPLKPQYSIEDACFDLSLSMFAPVFKRPGGKKAQKTNASIRLWELKRQLASCLYHGKKLADYEHCFWEEIMTTARWYLTQAMLDGNAWGLLNEGINKKGKRYWTLAGWMRHLARFIYYLRKAEVLPMEHDDFVYEPEMPALRQYFSQGSGMDCNEKVYTFLIGVLYGKLLQIQAARGVNVASNALTWLKRLHLSGKDLPELYIRIREKLLAYKAEGNEDIRDLEKEIARLGVRLGDKIRLDTVSTCYFLLLGQSVMTDILKKKDKEDADND